MPGMLSLLAALTHRLDTCAVSFSTQQGEEEPDESRNKEEKPDPGIPVRKAGRPGRKRKQPVVSRRAPVMPQEASANLCNDVFWFTMGREDAKGVCRRICFDQLSCGSPCIIL